MKRAWNFFLIMFLFFTAVAQRDRVWVGLAVKGGYGLGTLYHDQALFMDKSIVPDFTGAYSYGGRLNFIFGESNVSVSFEGLRTEFGQKFDIVDNSQVVSHYAKVSETDLGVIFKLASGVGFYFEVGPQLNLINSAFLDKMDVSKELSVYHTSFVLGGGFMPVFSQYFEVSIGLRALASLGNIIETDFNFYQDSPNAYDYVTNNTYKVLILPMIDINWIFAYMGRASCGKFRIMFNR